MCGVHVLCVCVFGGGEGERVDAREDEREKRSAQYICSLYFTAHYSVTQYVYLVFCILYLVCDCSSRVVCLPCL